MSTLVWTVGDADNEATALRLGEVFAKVSRDRTNRHPFFVGLFRLKILVGFYAFLFTTIGLLQEERRILNSYDHFILSAYTVIALVGFLMHMHSREQEAQIHVRNGSVPELIIHTNRSLVFFMTAYVCTSIGWFVPIALGVKTAVADVLFAASFIDLCISGQHYTSDDV